MALSTLKVRIVGNACIIRYDAGEGTLSEIIAANYAALTEDDQALVQAYVVAKRPDIEV